MNMKLILKFSGFISLMLFVFNMAILGLITPKTAAILLVFGIIMQVFSDNLFRALLPIASLVFFIWSLNGGNFSGIGQLLSLMISLIIMMLGISVMFSGFRRTGKTN